MNVKIGTVFLVQIAAGMLGNVSLLSQHLSRYLTDCRSRSTDLIFQHLSVANALVLLSRGIPETMAAFGLQNFLSDAGCKLVFYAHRVGRGASFGMICLLSVFQAITISSGIPLWAALKMKAPRCVSICAALCWVLHLLLNFNFPVNLVSKRKTTNTTENVDLGYCASLGEKKALYSVTILFVTSADVLCMGLMLSASGSMIFILFQHKYQVRYLHRTNMSSTSSPETRAVHSILILVSIFLSFYFLSAIAQMYLTFSQNHIPFLLTVNALITTCFPTLCPFVLMSRDHAMSRICCVCSEMNTHLSNVNRKRTCFI